MNKWLMPIAQKVDKQRHLSAIKASMVAMTPFTILGSFFAIIPALPNMIGENNAFSQFILNNAELLDLPVTLSIGMMSVYVTMCIAYNLGNHYKLYIPGCITLSTFAFLFVAAENVEGGISITNFGAKGLDDRNRLSAGLAGLHFLLGDIIQRILHQGARVDGVQRITRAAG